MQRRLSWPGKGALTRYGRFAVRETLWLLVETEPSDTQPCCLGSCERMCGV